MNRIKINGWEVSLLPAYNTEDTIESLSDLLANHGYNSRTDWQRYREVGKKWRRKKVS